MQLWLQLFLDIFYPNQCVQCGKTVHDNGLLCPDCRCALREVRFLYPSGFDCPHVDGICFFYSYAEGVKAALHKIKFRGKKGLLTRTATELAQADPVKILTEVWSLPPRMLVVPVATDTRRRKQRGYDLPSTIFTCLQQPPNYTWCEALSRIRPTLPQYGLKRQERRENVRNCFKVQQNVAGQEIFLVDDIFTSGATMEEAAKTLKKAGAKKVWALAFAGEALN